MSWSREMRPSQRPKWGYDKEQGGVRGLGPGDPDLVLIRRRLGDFVGRNKMVGASWGVGGVCVWRGKEVG